MKCALYLRRSVDRDRDERSISIESQRAAILAWTDRTRATILEDWTVEDRGYSGSTANRPGFQRLLGAARSGRAPFDCILVYDLDRFFRHHRKQQRYLDEFEDDHSIRVVSVTEEDDPELLRNVMGVINEEFRQKIVKHTVKAMHDIAKQGLSCGGTAPFGYMSVCGACGEPAPCRCASRVEGRRRPVRFVRNQDTAAIVQRIFNAYADGRSYKDIARVLNAEDVSTPGRGTLRAGKGWAASSIRVILLNETYLGRRVYNQTKKLGRRPTRQERRAPDEWIRVEGAHEPIIDLELWRRVQELRILRGARAFGRLHPGHCPGPYRQHLLSGYLVCDECDGRLTIEQSTSSTKRKYKYYLCRRSKEGACSNRASVRKDVAEEWVEAIIREAVLAPEHVTAYTVAVEDEVRRATAALGKERAGQGRGTIEKELGTISGQIENLLAFVCDGKADFGSARRKLDELESKRKSLESALATSPPIKGKPPSAAAVKAAVDRVRGAIARLTQGERRELLDALGMKIRVRPDRTAELTAEPGGLLDPVLAWAEAGAPDSGERLWVNGAGSGI